MFVHGESGLKIRISSPWGPYSISARHFGVVHKFFGGTEKYQVSAQNLKRLAFNFIEKCLSTTKTDQKFIFQPREAHILHRLDISVLYINFQWFLKILSFGSKPKGITFDFTKKCLFTMKTGWKSIFQPLWGTYSISVRRFGVVQKFLGFLKNIEFQLFGFTEKCLFTTKTGRKYVFQTREAHILS
jgi:hypothetical protein